MSTGLLGFGSIEERRGEADAYISASRLNCWLACPRRWAFRYLEGIRTPPSPALFVGKACHSALESSTGIASLELRSNPATLPAGSWSPGQGSSIRKKPRSRMSRKSRPCGSRSAIW